MDLPPNKPPYLCGQAICLPSARCSVLTEEEEEEEECRGQRNGGVMEWQEHREDEVRI